MVTKYGEGGLQKSNREGEGIDPSSIPTGTHFFLFFFFFLLKLLHIHGRRVLPVVEKYKLI